MEKSEIRKKLIQLKEDLKHLKTLRLKQLIDSEKEEHYSTIIKEKIKGLEKEL